PFLIKRLYRYQDRFPTPTREQINDILRPVLDHIDHNMPVLFYSGFTEVSTQYVSHIVVISGYEYDSNEELWLRISDPAMSFDVVQKAFPDRKGELLKNVAPGSWPDIKSATKPKEPARGSRWDVKASVLFMENKKMRGK